MKLYSYCLRSDSGSAPNPFGGLCTLAICKPSVRRTAEVGDWVVGLGSVNSPIGDISDCVVYAMRVTGKMAFEYYDCYCNQHLPIKLSDWNSQQFEKKVGDCIYDYSGGNPPKIRYGIHDERSMATDLGGKYVLMSNELYYFGNNASLARLPINLHGIIHRAPGHKSKANDPYRNDFVSWIRGLGFKKNTLHGDPQNKELIMKDSKSRDKICRIDLDESNSDKEAC